MLFCTISSLHWERHRRRTRAGKRFGALTIAFRLICTCPGLCLVPCYQVTRLFNLIWIAPGMVGQSKEPIQFVFLLPSFELEFFGSLIEIDSQPVEIVRGV